MTGGRLKRVKDYLDDEDFCFTYGDGLCDIDIKKLIKFHQAKERLSTISGVYPPGRFGALNLSGDRVIEFKEKPKGDGSLINGGYFVLSPKVLDLIEGDKTTWEKEPMEELASQGQMSCMPHEGFWQPMDTLRDKELLEKLWESGQAPWKKW
jgi:glucose-1-phosphate cytidylyltransferase